LECYTTEPGLQLYTANYASGYKGANGATSPIALPYVLKPSTSPTRQTVHTSPASF
jgi:aldose 1-epimerase